VGIRPEKIGISMKATTENTANNSITTTVTEVIFTGNQFTIVTRTIGGQELRATIPNNSHFEKPEIGEDVQLEWKTSDTILMGEHDE
jgi:ABC-type Fe3+/spermidine/putrescine transport system ATPase subunit